MPRAYPLDLRTRVGGYVDAGHSRHAPAAHFDASVSLGLLEGTIERPP